MPSTQRTSLKEGSTLSELTSLSATDIDRTLFETDTLVQITSVLHTSLDVAQIVELFSKEVKNFVRFDCVKFVYDKQNIDLKFGRNSKFTRSYQLEINDLYLGDITFTRRVDFEKRETKEIENLIQALIYPLRNALMYQQALHDAHKDPLTGIGNRAAFNETMKREIELAHRHTTPLAMIVIDIDYFKKINDNYGHYVGDCILKKLALCTKDIIRKSDMLFRYGGEEFVVLLPNTDSEGAVRLAQRIRRKVEKSECECDGHTLTLTISAGVSQLKEKDSANDLFVKADTALYEAKADGRNSVKVAK